MKVCDQLREVGVDSAIMEEKEILEEEIEIDLKWLINSLT